MASIVIRDLTENTILDHEAMAAVIGGARLRGRPVNLGPAFIRGARIVDFPGVPRRKRPAAAQAGTPGSGASTQRK